MAAGGPRAAWGSLLRKEGREGAMGLTAGPSTSCCSCLSFQTVQMSFLDLPGVISSSSLCLLQFPVPEELPCR